MNYNPNTPCTLPTHEILAPPFPTFNWFNSLPQLPNLGFSQSMMAQTQKPIILDHLPDLNDIDYFGFIEVEANISEDQLRAHDILEIALIITRDGDVQMKKRWLIQPKISQEIHQLSKQRSGLTVDLLKLDGNTLNTVITDINQIIQRLQLSLNASNFVFVTQYEQTFQNYLLNAFEYFKIEDDKFFKRFVCLNDSLPPNLQNQSLKTIMDGLNLPYEKRQLRDSMTEAKYSQQILEDLLSRNQKLYLKQIHKFYDQKSYDPIRGFLSTSSQPTSDSKRVEQNNSSDVPAKSKTPQVTITEHKLKVIISERKDTNSDRKRKLHPNAELYRRIENKYLTTNEQDSSFKETLPPSPPQTQNIPNRKATQEERGSPVEEKKETAPIGQNVDEVLKPSTQRPSFFGNEIKQHYYSQNIDFIDFSRCGKEGISYRYLLVLHVGNEIGFILYEVGAKKSYNKFDMYLPIHRKEIKEKSWLLTEAIQKLEDFLLSNNLNTHNCCAVTSVYPNSLLELQNKYKYFSGQNLPKLLLRYILIPELVGDYFDITTRPERPPLQFFVDYVGARCLLDDKIFMTICIIDKMSEKIHWTSKLINYQLKESAITNNNRRQKNRRFKVQ